MKLSRNDYVQAKAFAILVLGVFGVVGWLVLTPDPTRQEQEKLFQKSAPELARSFQRVLEHSEQLGVERRPASIPTHPAQMGSADPVANAPMESSGSSNPKAEALTDLVLSPVRDENDLLTRFHQARQHYESEHSDAAVGTLRELVSMVRALYPESTSISDLEKQLQVIEQDRIQRINEGEL